VPRVPNAERASMIESARQDGLPQFDFTERDVSGALTLSGLALNTSLYISWLLIAVTKRLWGSI
jgi:hypothetical protein